MIRDLPQGQTQSNQPVCNCNMRTKLIGSGCAVCNPDLARFLGETVMAYMPTINAEFDKFFEFDSADRSHVTSMSAKLFALHMLEKRDNEMTGQELAELIEWAKSLQSEKASS